MKNLPTFLTVLLFISLGASAQAQYVNVRFGQIPFSNSMWNTWKTASKANDTSAYLVDILGNKTKVRAVLSNSGIVFDNGAGYLAGKGVYPDTVLREGIYQNSGASCTLTLIGLDTSTIYSISLFGSRNRTDLQGDKFKTGPDSISIAAEMNATAEANFTGLKTLTGAIAFNVSPIAQFLYINSIQVSGIPSHSQAVAKIGIDSTIINYPNSLVRMTGMASTGVVDSAYSWSEVSGPSQAIFTSQGDSMVMSGLRPGTYKFRLMVTDGAFISDSAFVSVTVNGAPACPVCAVCPVCPPPVVCPVCPICPAPRTVKGVSKDEITGIITITFSDGTTQTIVTQ